MLSYTAWATGQVTRLGAMASHAKVAQLALVVKKPHASAGDVGDVGPVPGSGRAPGERHGCPRQDSCRGNPLDRGAWRGYSPWSYKELETTKHSTAQYTVNG